MSIFFCKELLVNILGFAGCTVYVTNTQLWEEPIPIYILRSVHDCIPIKLYLQTQCSCACWSPSLCLFHQFRRECLEISNHDCGFLYLSFHLFSFCCMDFEAELLGTLTFRIVSFSGPINPFIIVKCPSLFLVMVFVLKSTFYSQPAFFFFFSNCRVHICFHSFIYFS